MTLVVIISVPQISSQCKRNVCQHDRLCTAKRSVTAGCNRDDVHPSGPHSGRVHSRGTSLSSHSQGHSVMPYVLSWPLDSCPSIAESLLLPHYDVQHSSLDCSRGVPDANAYSMLLSSHDVLNNSGDSVLLLNNSYLILSVLTNEVRIYNEVLFVVFYAQRRSRVVWYRSSCRCCLMQHPRNCASQERRARRDTSPLAQR